MTVREEKISALQLGVLLFFGISATAVLSVPNITGFYAKNDSWISIVWASLSGYITTFFSVRLYMLSPGKTIMQTIEQVVGKYLGKLIGLLYIVYLLILSGVIVRTYAEFIITSFMSKTPIFVIVGSILLVSAYAVFKGIEVIARAALVILPFFLLPLLFMPLLGKDMDVRYIFPIFGHGVLPSLKGAMPSQAWFGEIILLSFLLPFLKSPQKAMRVGMRTTFLLMLLLTTINLFILFIFGHHVEDMEYPVMAAFSFIRIADFLENMESLIMAIWVVGAFVKIAVFYYTTSLATSQWLGLSTYQPIVLPAGLLIGLFSFWSMPNMSEMIYFNQRVFPFYGLCMQAILPGLLLLVSVIRAGRGKQKSSLRSTQDNHEKA